MSTQDKDVAKLASKLGLDPVILADPCAEKPKNKRVSTKKSKPEQKNAVKSKQKTPKKPAVESSMGINTQEIKTEASEAQVTAEIEDNTLHIPAPPQRTTFHGYLVNHLAKPFEVVDGVERELTVPFSSAMLERYRQTNGSILMRIYQDSRHRRGMDKLEVYIRSITGELEPVCSVSNYSRAMKRAKTWASLLQLAFNPKEDIIYEEQRAN